MPTTTATLPLTSLRRLRCADYAVDPATLARALLGRLLVRVVADDAIAAGRIVETEAYLGEHDMAAHSFGGRRTPRTEPMYGPPGTAYVFFTYGMHDCFNVVCGRRNEPVAVLIRALEPVLGIDLMQAHRTSRDRKPLPAHHLCRGPARLCAALDIDRALNHADLTRDPRLFLAHDQGAAPVDASQIGASPRIGVDYAQHWAHAPLRFFLKGSPSLSGPRSLASPQTAPRPRQGPFPGPRAASTISPRLRRFRP